MSPSGEIIEFGRFRLHRRNRTLQADGQELDLGARAIDVLLALIDAGGTMVTKDELLERVWPESIVEENNLYVQIFALRRALGADRVLIRTVPGRGYLFTGDVIAATRTDSAANGDGSRQSRRVSTHAPFPRHDAEFTYPTYPFRTAA